MSRPAANHDGRVLGRIAPLSFWTAAVATTIALIVSRRPDGIWRPQFWAEDGRIWYAQAYNDGAISALLTPAGGYLQSFSRLTAALSLAFDLGNAPLVFNVAAVLAQATVPLYLLSSRLASALPDLRVRMLAALLVIGAPNGFEIQSNVTNTQTHLALLALLIVLADRPRGLAWVTFDVVFLLLAGMSGPTCVLLVPIAGLAWRHQRSRWRLVILLVLLVPASVQAFTYWWTQGAGRIATPLGASVLRFLQIVGGQIFVAGTLSSRGYAFVLWLGDAFGSSVTAIFGIAGLLLVARALLVTRSFPLRMLVLFATLALAAALWNPAIGMPERWQAMRVPNAGIRYYAPPILAFLAVTLWSACADPDRRFRLAARAVLTAVLLVGMPLDWRVEPRADLDFPSHVARFAAAPAGAKVRIPIPPVGWRMILYKH